MYLTLDYGNTRNKFSVWQDQTVVEHGVFENDFPEIGDELKLITAVAWSNTSGITPQFPELPDAVIYPIKSALKLLQTSVYKTPETLGDDRLAGILGAVKQFPGKNVLVIDAGTCITADLVTAEKVYEGGVISPGIGMRLRAMHEFTAALPLPDRSKLPKPGFNGRDTAESMLAGVMYGIAGELNFRIHQLLRNYPDLTVVFTGGDMADLKEYVNYQIFAEPLLVHYGLLYFLEQNEN